MKIVCIGAAPTGLGAAFRLHELQESGDEKALDTQLVLFEQVKIIANDFTSYIIQSNQLIKWMKFMIRW